MSAPDFRANKMDSPEGKGIARRAWETYADAVNRAAMPMLEPSVRNLSVSVVADLTGFWVLWHLHGGFEGLRELGMSRSAIYRRVKRFRTVFGVHPDEYQHPGVRFDVAAYYEAARAERERSTSDA